MQAFGVMQSTWLQMHTACCLQVEQNLHPNLKGRAFALQQHQDIIAVSPDFLEVFAAVLLPVTFDMHPQLLQKFFR